MRLLPPSVFWPRPKVTSAILHIERDDSDGAAIGNPVFFHHFVRALFTHRRKFLRSVLVAAYKESLGKPGVDAVLAELGLSPEGRAEQLDVPTMLRLSDAVERGWSTPNRLRTAASPVGPCTGVAKRSTAVP